MTADPVQPESVCIVDDDEAWLELLRLVLETRCGISEVETFTDGALAVRRLREHPAAPPRLLLLDYHMPRLNGPGVLAALREAGRRPPTAMISNAASPAEREACLRDGAFAFVQKPVRADELARALQDLLQLAAQSAAAQPRVLRVVVADDHELVRSGFCALLSLLPEVEVVAEARDGAQLLEVLGRTRVDLVLCDLGMPGMDGLAAIERMLQAHPHVRTIVVSMDDAPATARRALARGAAGFVAKQGASAELEDAIRTVAAGGRYVSRALEAAMRGGDDSPEAQLTPRQIEILTLVAQGHTARDIGGQLGLSPNTVDVHRARIMERLGLHDIPALTRYAMKHRLVH
jgi:DNA-binding NarL/FixJ family response regulator